MFIDVYELFSTTSWDDSINRSIHASISAESRREKFVSEAEEMAASWPSCILMYLHCLHKICI